MSVILRRSIELFLIGLAFMVAVSLLGFTPPARSMWVFNVIIIAGIMVMTSFSDEVHILDRGLAVVLGTIGALALILIGSKIIEAIGDAQSYSYGLWIYILPPSFSAVGFLTVLVTLFTLVCLSLSLSFYSLKWGGTQSI